MKKLLNDPRFKNVSYYGADVRATFRRERARLKAIATREADEKKAAAARQAAVDVEAAESARALALKVAPLRRR